MKRAFTLIELLVVFAILAILGSIVISAVQQYKHGKKPSATNVDSGENLGEYTSPGIVIKPGDF